MERKILEEGNELSKRKATLFFSASSVGDYTTLRDFGIKDTLVSYFYLRKSLKFYPPQLEKQHKEGGIFMTDSGAFSFMGKKVEHKMTTEEYWLPYLEEYVAWLHDNKKFIFVAANLDLDMIVGREVVDRWNEKYFKPLEKDINVVYVVHQDAQGDKTGLLRLKEYCQLHNYVGCNQTMKDNAAEIYRITNAYGTKVHGFAWTEMNLLQRFPFFSVDSVTWLGGTRFGTTYNYDGKNFGTIDYKHKYRRKANRIKYEDAGLSMDDIRDEKRIPINNMNLLGWLGFRREFLKIAHCKLKNKPVLYYDKTRR